jgi:hypothetical protein
MSCPLVSVEAGNGMVSEKLLYDKVKGKAGLSTHEEAVTCQKERKNRRSNLTSLDWMIF